MKRGSLITFLFLTGCCIQAVGQGHEIDSLRKALKKEKDDTNKVNTLSRLSELLWRNGKDDTTKACANSEQALAEKLGYKKGIAHSLADIGNCYSDEGNFTKALECHSKALEIYQEIGDQMGQARSFNNIASNYEYKSNYPKAIEYQLKALKIDRKLGDKAGIAIDYGNLGNKYDDEGDFSKALEYDLKALDIDSELGDKADIAIDMGNVANVYMELGNYSKTLEYDFNALKMNREMGNKKMIAIVLGNIGNIYRSQSNYPEALKYDSNALLLLKEIGDKGGVARNLGNIGNIYALRHSFSSALKYDSMALAIYREIGDKSGLDRNLGNIGAIYNFQGNYERSLQYEFDALAIQEEIGDKQEQALNFASIGVNYTKQKIYKQAKIYLDSALDLSKHIGNKAAIEGAYGDLANLDSSQSNYKAALEEYKMSVTYHDSLINEANTKKTITEQMNYAFTVKADSTKLDQEKKDALVMADKHKQSIITGIVSGGLLLVLLLAGFIFRSLRITRRQKQIIEIKSKETEEQKKVVEEKNKDITDSINYAKRIQRALLKEEEHVSMHLPEHFILFKPKDIVSGDFYWALEKEEYFYFAAVDCTGHGVPGGFMSMLGLSYLNEITKGAAIQTPAEILDELCTKVLTEFKQKEGEDQTKDGMDISLMRMNLKTREMEWSGANNPLYVINDEVKEIPADKQPIGYFPLMKPFTNHTVKAEKGSIIYLFSDGYADQFGGEKGKKFRHSQFKEVLLSIHKMDLKKQKKTLNETFENWKGKLEQVDDILVIGIRV